ncbi:MAG: hypothetical protein KDC53_01025 [Saprospiraceae bacterium]|nr:hypothetical protein [Saprospiraceae bacterium]
MMEIPDKYKSVIVEALEDLLYKVSLDLAKMKGSPLTTDRKRLTKKQRQIEELQHRITSDMVKS